MSKAVLISIKPKCCEKIDNGEKTIEVRKTKPNIETPFKCYIYCTKFEVRRCYGKAFSMNIITGEKKKLENKYTHKWSQKVIGEFICDKIDKYTLAYGFSEKENKYGKYGKIKDYAYNIHDSVYRTMCLTEEEFYNYLKGEVGYGYHITNLKVYDKPKELSEFRCVGQCCQWNKIEIKENVFGDYVDNCYNNSFCKTCCKYYNHDFEQCDKPYSHFLTRPPQSWCYVEDLGE